MGSPTTFPSLYQLACIRYSPDTDTLHNIAIPATVDIFSDNSSIGIILERRKTIDDVLPYPPRYNPYQWRLVYAPELTPGKDDSTKATSWQHFLCIDKPGEPPFEGKGYFLERTTTSNIMKLRDLIFPRTRVLPPSPTTNAVRIMLMSKAR